MASKRELDIDDGEIQEPQQKRSKKHNAKLRQHQNSGIDPTWGQKYVFSATEHKTTIPAGEEDDFEDDAEAMAYLNSVRQEAGRIPHLLVAPKVRFGPQLPADFRREDDTNPDDDEPIDRRIYDDGTGDTRGYYEDGAYTAMPDFWGEEGEWDDEQALDEETELDDERALHEAYFESVLDQYLRLRSILNSKPPPNAISRLSKSQPTYASHVSSAIALWSRVIRTSDPHPLQVALMSKDTVLQILRILLGGKFLRRGYTLPERTSRWIWALLARLPDKGELNYSEIGWVRDLGRRAVLLGRSLAEMAALREELADGGLGAHEGVDRSSTDEDVLADMDDVEVEDAMSHGGEEQGTSEPSPEPTKSNANEPEPAATSDVEEGEVDEDEAEDVAMDLASDSESEDGEVSDQSDIILEDARTRLLAQLENNSSSSDDEGEEQEIARDRSRANLRATLNMILTVAGEFYGQRDLLEFREPFVGM